MVLLNTSIGPLQRVPGTVNAKLPAVYEISYSVIERGNLHYCTTRIGLKTRTVLGQFSHWPYQNNCTVVLLLVLVVVCLRLEHARSQE